MHLHIGRHVEERLRVVEHDLHAGLYDRVGRRLARLGGNGENSDDDVPLAADRLELRERADWDSPDRLSDFALVVVEDRRDCDPVLGEDRLPRPA